MNLVIVSRNGWVRARTGHGLDLTGTTYKDGDAAYAVFETRSIHSIAMVDSTGRAFSVEAAELPGGKGDGVSFTSMVELAPGARLAHVVDAQPGRRYLFANSGGYGFIAKSANIDELDPAFVDMPIVRERVDDVALDCALSNSFGFGGTNASLVLQRYAA